MMMYPNVNLTYFRFLKLLNYSEKIAGLSSIVWLLGTSVLFYSSFHQQNNQILLFVLISYQTALAYAIKAQKRLAILSGIALGIAFLTRITSILYAVGVLMFMIGCVARQYKFKPVSQSLRSIALWMTGFIPFVLLERILTYYRYGSWVATSTSLHLQVYARANSLIDPNAIAQGDNKGFSFLKLLAKVQPEGLLAPLFSPEKSIFIYDPLLLPCLILLFVCWKSLSQYIRWYVVTISVSFLLHLYIYSWTSEWIKQGEWGARYRITSIHLLLIPLIPILIIGATKRITKSTAPAKILLSAIAKIIVVMAILIQFTSIVLPYGLEANQQELGVGSRFRLVQRMYNISYMLDSKPHFQISKVEQKWQIDEPNRKVIWDLLPFRYQDKLGNNSSLNKFIPILFVVWSLILIAAIASTLWVFVEQ